MTNSIVNIKKFQNTIERPVNYNDLPKYRNLNKKTILINLYSKQRVLAELKTAQAVESCQELMGAEIEKHFLEKYNQVSKLINKLSTSKVCDVVNYYSLITPTDVMEITSLMEKVLQRELEKHFIIRCQASLELDCCPNQLFSLVEDWQKTTNRTLVITRQVEKWSKNYLHKAIKLNFQNIAFFHIAKNLKFSSALLKSLGIDARETKAEFLIEMRNRLEGSIDSIKSRIIIDLKEKVAQVFYQIHDQVIDHRLLEKITLLEKGLNEERGYSLMRREA
ncbi:hypothetical protein [Desulfosporosinus sp. OT]|uniref:hypothetical protein n=1 Tax=Desulfosporosinus sp. OT TaxID=913865 RepID=UPI0002239E24|nr:hypothetical protein [Desulfosporosinus sp. OT]EGW40069.1 hypothetical protein DOT_1784 [Desulfosporosinus sp. OT]